MPVVVPGVLSASAFAAGMLTGWVCVGVSER